MDAYYTEAGIPRPDIRRRAEAQPIMPLPLRPMEEANFPLRACQAPRWALFPSPYKAGEIFLGWYYDEELGQAVASSDRLTGSLTLYAKYEKAGEIQENGSARFTAAMDVDPGFTIAVKSAGSQNAEAVKAPHHGQKSEHGYRGRYCYCYGRKRELYHFERG